jgi:nitrous oxide reductase accessory protein NosL
MKNIYKNCLASTFLLAFALFGCQKAKQNETNNTQEITSSQISVSQITDCGNCGMPSKDYPKWNVKLLQTKETKRQEQFFCSPRCMFTQVIATNPKLQNTDSILVVDYYEQKMIDAQKAFFVIGSDVIAPMGHDFVPFSDEKAASDFLTEHKGKKIVKFNEVTNNVILDLDK